MKKSNLILLIGLVLIVFLSLAFQISVHGYLKKDKTELVIGTSIEELRTLPRFKKIVVNNRMSVFFKQDSLISLRIAAPESYMPYLKTEVRGDSLVIERTKKLSKEDNVKIFISSPILDALTVKDDGYFETEGNVSGSNLRLDFRKESSGKLNLSYKQIDCKKENGAQLNLSGNSEQINFSN